MGTLEKSIMLNIGPRTEDIRIRNVLFQMQLYHQISMKPRFEIQFFQPLQRLLEKSSFEKEL